ncbi:hypothetical protein [Burkholderia sp. BCC0397]|uniref:hypothetical protein n=1 Tax=Burkholderia sp. BCC0397 TaxID=486876 RepID=UPI00158D5902|nr:hypothetical protein [Burkholderia sp. BCC0397]
MKMRRILMGGGLVASALIAVFGDRSNPGEAVGATRRALVPTSERSPGPIQATTASASDRVGPDSHQNGVLLLRDRVSPTIRKNDIAPFAVTSWTPPPPISSVEEKPTAPPLPFTYLGKELEGDQWRVFLAKGDEVLIVKANDVIRDTYRVESITPPTATIRYLPLNEAQQLNIQ